MSTEGQPTTTIDSLPFWRRWLHYSDQFVWDVIIRVADALRVPGVIRSIEYTHAVSGDKIKISVGLWETQITVGRTDFYFSRFTGKCTGHGIAMPSPEEVEKYMEVYGGDKAVRAYNQMRPDKPAENGEDGA